MDCVVLGLLGCRTFGLLDLGLSGPEFIHGLRVLAGGGRGGRDSAMVIRRGPAAWLGGQVAGLGGLVVDVVEVALVVEVVWCDHVRRVIRHPRAAIPAPPSPRCHARA